MPNLNVRSYTTFETRNGRCAIAWTSPGIAGFLLPTNNENDIRQWHYRRVPNARLDSPDERTSKVIEAAVRYFEGEIIDFSDVAVDLGNQTPFFEQIYRNLRKVPYGQTTTYGALANEAGAGREMARGVGVAMATNPTPLIIPCHRVLAAGGKISGFSAPGGSNAKAKMLEMEGVQIGPEEKKPLPSAQQAFDF